MINNPVTRVEETGFYQGYNRGIAIAVKVIIVLLVLWAATAPNAGDALLAMQAATIEVFSGWYIGATTVFMVLCLALAVLPKILGQRLCSA